MRYLQEMTDAAIRDAHVKKEYRPVAAALIVDLRGRILLIQFKKFPTDWGLPQGGIEPGEDLFTSLFREIEEETSIRRSDLGLRRYLGTADLDANHDRKDKRGFTKGKRYFAVKLCYAGSETLTLNAAELTGYVWCDQGGIASALHTTRAEKRDLIMRFTAPE